MTGAEPGEPDEAAVSTLRRQVDELQRALASAREGRDAGDAGDAGADRAYRVIVESMGEGAATVSERGVILYANPRLAELLGVERDGMAGRDLADFVGVEQLPVLTTLLTGRAPGGTRAELEIPRPDGTVVPVLVVSTELHIDTALVHCLVATEMALDLDQRDLARTLVARTSSHARHWIGELVKDETLEPGSALRSGPARGGTEHP